MKITLMMNINEGIHFDWLVSVLELLEAEPLLKSIFFSVLSISLVKLDGINQTDLFGEKNVVL